MTGSWMYQVRPLPDGRRQRLLALDGLVHLLARLF